MRADDGGACFDEVGPMKRLDGRIAVVTGAGSGIGRATSIALAQRGCSVAIVDMQPAGAEETAEMVRAHGPRASVHLADVRDPNRMDELPAEVAEALGPCQILINNAGVTAAGAFTDESLEDLHWIVDINVWGVIHGCRAFLGMLGDADEAHIVNMSSMVGLLGLPHNVSYSLTKGAVRAFSEALRGELVTSNVGLTVVFPGAIHTNITSNARGGQGARLADMGRSRLAPYVMRPPSVVANKIVSAIERDRPRVVVGPDAHVLSVLTRAL
ncbi:MAG TPA: SDR family NAD(P)-dependent oxidoreductase, partial [Microthrixaceae bacterium]|nr:SDR family NAD(P)-dependent oxidoreductase [Microthrixaceae bacterium]